MRNLVVGSNPASFRETPRSLEVFIENEWDFQLAKRIGQVVEHHVSGREDGVSAPSFLTDEGDVVVVEQVASKNRASGVSPSANKDENLSVEGVFLGRCFFASSVQLLRSEVLGFAFVAKSLHFSQAEKVVVLVIM